MCLRIRPNANRKGNGIAIETLGRRKVHSSSGVLTKTHLYLVELKKIKKRNGNIIAETWLMACRWMTARLLKAKKGP